MREPGGRYAFEHLLTREAAYAALLERNRCALHSLAADVLSARLRPGTLEEWELLPLICDHLNAAGRVLEAHERRCELLVLMAQTGRFEAWERSLDAARGNWEAARQADPALPGASQKLLYCEALLSYSRGQFAPALEAAQAALAGAAPEVSALLVMLSAQCLHRLGRSAEALQGYAAALDAFAAAGDLPNQCEVERGMAVLARDQGDGEASLRHNVRALELARACGNKRLEAVSLISACNSASIFGSLRDAESYLRGALELATALGDLQSRATALNLLSEMEMCCAGPAVAESTAREALGLTEVTGNLRSRTMSLSYLALAVAAQGRIEEARTHIDDAREICDRLQYVWGRSFTTYWGAITELDFGDLEKAGRLCAEALEAASQMGNALFQIPLTGTLGQIELLRGNLEGALERLLPAARQCGQVSAYFALRVLAQSALACQRAGRKDEARHWILQGRQRCTEFAEHYPNAPLYLSFKAAEEEVCGESEPRI